MTLSENMLAPVQDAQLTELEAEMIRDAARSFATDISPLSVVRAAEAGDWSAAKDSWPQLAELGWLALLQDDDDEMVADGLLAATIIAEELGRAAYPMPFTEMATLALPLIARSGADIDLNALTAGEGLVAVAFPSTGIANSISELPEVGCDTSLIANQLNDAAHLLVPARNGNQPVLLIATRPANGWKGNVQADLANNSYCSIAVEDLTAAGQISVEWSMLAQVFDYFRLATAAQIVGMASQATDIAVEYAKERIAFDKPIGSFQAVQQRLAEAALELAGAHYVVQEAAATRNHSMIAVACLQVCEAGTKSTFTAQQIWGGMGYTMEVDVQLFFRRARACQLLLGRSWELKERIWDEFIPH